MLGQIRKHSGWLWFIIAATVIAFVLWGAQTQKLANSEGSAGNFGSISGKRIRADQYYSAQREAILRFFFMNGEWPNQNTKRANFDEQRDTYQRLLLIREMEDLNIHVNSETIATAAAEQIAHFNQGNPVPLDIFVQRVLEPQKMTADDLIRYMGHEIGFQQLVAMIGAGGRLVTPQEMRSLYEREREDVSVQAVFFSASNYIANVSIPVGAYGQFYSNQMARYHLPERVQVNYVRFAASNFMAEATHDLAQITNIDEQISAILERMPTNFDAEAKTVSEKKAKIRQLMLEKQAMTDATKRAVEFTRNLDAMEPKLGNLALAAKTNGLHTELSEPFDRDMPPENLNVGLDFVKAAFDLSPEQSLFFGPLKGGDAAYVIELARRIPDEIPPLEQIHDQVAADYKLTQAVLFARLAGAEFYNTATNGLGRGKSFSALCTEARVHAEYLPPFSISTRTLPQVEGRVALNQFKQAVFSTTVGRVSPFTPDADGGFLVFVQSKLPVDQAAMQAELPKFAAMVQQNRQYEAFNEWFSREAQRSLRDTPLMQKQPQPAATPK